MRLYHYTNIRGYQGIVSTKELIPSTNTAMDAGYGVGWYFTDLAPNSCEIQIYNECFGGRNPNKKIDHYIFVDIPDMFIRQCRNHIFLIPLNSKTSFKLITHGRKKNCLYKPCEKCSKNTRELRDSVNQMDNILGVIVIGGLAIAGLILLLKAFSD